jgi:DNA (cytosine-5)-methyltransferase 1
MNARPLLSQAKVIDLFSGIGGLSHGFLKEGFDVVAGIDIDETCKYGFEVNNKAKFIHKNITDVTAQELAELYGESPVRILVGCAPCQPFSTLNSGRAMYQENDDRWEPLEKFSKLIVALKPEIVSMENVKDLADTEKYPIFKRFVDVLKKNGYHVSYRVVDASRYGVPQRRKRLVLLGSRLGSITLIPETHDDENMVTVRQTIGDLPRLKDGMTHETDPLHKSSKLNEINKKRIRATPRNGGGPKDWKRSLLPDCYKGENTYKASVYGRMRWDEPSPTITTNCTTLGTGRYGHPTQNRAISLREAARLQTFPDYYRFDPSKEVSITKLAKFIGNAVPVQLGKIIARSIKYHLKGVVV